MDCSISSKETQPRLSMPIVITLNNKGREETMMRAHLLSLSSFGLLFLESSPSLFSVAAADGAAAIAATVSAALGPRKEKRKRRKKRRRRKCL